jgi:divalent metal cation (Fe/Co/Zn/Cd) transporter
MTIETNDRKNLLAVNLSLATNAILAVLALAGVPGVRKIEEIHVHRIGLYLLIQVTIGVDGSLTVAEGDRIASEVERVLYERIEFLRRVSVHYHPARPA